MFDITIDYHTVFNVKQPIGKEMLDKYLRLRFVVFLIIVSTVTVVEQSISYSRENLYPIYKQAGYNINYGYKICLISFFQESFDVSWDVKPSLG